MISKYVALLGLYALTVCLEILGLPAGWTWGQISTPFVLIGLLAQLGLFMVALCLPDPGASIHHQYDPADTDSDGVNPRSYRQSRQSSRGPLLGVGILVLAFLGGTAMVGTSGCAAAQPQPADRSPAAARAQKAQQIEQRVGEFQQSVIDGQRAGKITTEDARTLVTWTVTTVKAIQQWRQDGVMNWYTTAAAGWTQVRPIVVANPTMSSWASVIDGLLAGGF